MSTRNFLGGSNPIEANQLAFEFMLNGLRCYQPVSADLFEKRTGLAWESLAGRLKQAEAKGLLTWDSKKLQLTELGNAFYNDVVALFL